MESTTTSNATLASTGYLDIIADTETMLETAQNDILSMGNAAQAYLISYDDFVKNNQTEALGKEDATLLKDMIKEKIIGTVNSNDE